MTMSSDTFQLNWPDGMEASESSSCPLIGDIVRIAEEGGQLPIEQCRCQRCISALVDAVANANFARRIQAGSPPPLTSDAVPSIRIRLNPPLGRGGQASVYFGVDPQTADCVAVKILARNRCDSMVHIGRLFYEAVWLRQLATPGLVEFHSCGVTHTGKPYLCTKYVEGPTLAQMLGEQRLAKLRPAERFAWALQVTAGILRPLQALHQRGIVHCDLKPSNILMRHGEEPVLLDLGIAAASGNSQAGGEDAVFSGSRPYAAPERIRLGDEANEPVVDVYSLGIMLEELAFEHGPGVTHPSRLGALLRAIIAKATDEDPPERFANAGEMLSAVAAAQLTFERKTSSLLRLSVAALALVSVALLGSTMIWLWGAAARTDAAGTAAVGNTSKGTSGTAFPQPGFSPRDLLVTLRTEWERRATPAPDHAKSLQSLEDAKLYFGAIEPLSEWGYVGGETVAGQIISVATDPLEIVHRDGRSKLTLLQPVLGITRTIDRPGSAFPRTSISPNNKWILVYGMDREFEVIDRATLATLDQGTREFRPAGPPIISNDGRHIAHIDADGRVCLRGSDGRWTIPFTVASTDSMCAFNGPRLIVVTRSGEAVSYDLISHNIAYHQVAHPPCPPFRLNTHATTSIVTFSNGQTWYTSDGGVNWNPISPFAQARDAVAIQSEPLEVIAFSQGVGRSLDSERAPAVQSGFSRVIHAAIAENRQVLVTHGRTWRLLDPSMHGPWVHVSGDVDAEMFAQRVDGARIFAGDLGVWRVSTDSEKSMCLLPASTSNASVDDAQDRLLTAGYSGNVDMISPKTGEHKWSYQRDELGTPVVALWEDFAVIGGNDSTVTALDAATGTVRWVRQDQRYRIRGVSAGAGRIASASSSPGIVIYDTNGVQQSLCRFIDARCVALSPDASRFVAGSDRGTIITGTATSRVPTTEVLAHDGGVWSVAVNPTGTLAATGGGDGIVRLWWLHPLTPLARFAIAPESSTVVFDLRFSDDSRKLCCTVMSQGAYEIDLAQHAHTLDDWLSRDRAYASSSRAAPTSHEQPADDADDQ